MVPSGLENEQKKVKKLSYEEFHKIAKAPLPSVQIYGNTYLIAGCAAWKDKERKLDEK